MACVLMGEAGLLLLLRALRLPLSWPNGKKCFPALQESGDGKCMEDQEIPIRFPSNNTDLGLEESSWAIDRISS